MIKHIVMWRLKDCYSAEEKTAHLTKIKTGLEALADIVPGIVSLQVHPAALDSSSYDAVLDSQFVNEDALKGYKIHPEHRKVAEFVHSVMEMRACVDYDD